jgi:rare lipoprotein A
MRNLAILFSFVFVCFSATLFAQENVGNASIFPDGFEGKKMASGELYRATELTAAHRTLPFNTKIRITRVDNGKSVVVRVTDRGPFVNANVLDISRAAARALDFTTGTAKVKFEEVGSTSGVIDNGSVTGSAMVDTVGGAEAEFTVKGAVKKDN